MDESVKVGDIFLYQATDHPTIAQGSIGKVIQVLLDPKRGEKPISAIFLSHHTTVWLWKVDALLLPRAGDHVWSNEKTGRGTALSEKGQVRQIDFYRTERDVFGVVFPGTSTEVIWLKCDEFSQLSPEEESYRRVLASS